MLRSGQPKKWEKQSRMKLEISQIAYHVADIRTACNKMFLQFGAGPFIISENIKLADGNHRGKKTQFVHSSAYGQWGNVMLELVKQEDNSMNTPFREMYGPNEEGIHHTALIVDNFDKAIAHFESCNMPLLTSCTTAQGCVEFGFIDARTTLGHMIEIYERSPTLLNFYQLVKDRAKQWDQKDLFFTS